MMEIGLNGKEKKGWNDAFCDRWPVSRAPWAKNT